MDEIIENKEVSFEELKVQHVLVFVVFCLHSINREEEFEEVLSQELLDDFVVIDQLLVVHFRPDLQVYLLWHLLPLLQVMLTRPRSQLTNPSFSNI